jgi:hypothetical protein
MDIKEVYQGRNNRRKDIKGHRNAVRQEGREECSKEGRKDGRKEGYQRRK